MTQAIYELRFKTGEVLSAWTSLRTRESFTDPLGSYEFAFSPPRSRRREFRALLQRGKIVQLFCNGAQQASPIITSVREKIGAHGHTFTLQCKSLLCTAHEGCVDPAIGNSLGADTRISEIVLKALKPYGFTTIGTDATGLVSAMTGAAVNGRGAPVSIEELTHKQTQAQPGEPGYAYAARIFSRAGVALGCDHNGELILRRPDYSQAPLYDIVQDDDRSHAGDRFLLDPEAEVEATNDGQFSEYVVLGKSADVYGQQSTGAADGGVITEGTVRPAGCPFEKLALANVPRGRHSYSAPDAPYKPRFRLDKKARDKVKCEAIAHLMRGIHASEAWRLKCSVRGWVAASGAVWTVDTIARVYAQDFEIDEELWIYEVERSLDKERGPITSLTLIPKGALLLGEEG